MKMIDGWWFPDGETHLPAWMANPKARMILNGRPAYQGKKQRAALELCGSRAGTAIDVGAHIGLWSYNLAHHFADVQSFEPVLDHRACFERNVVGEGIPAVVTLHSCALGEKPGSVSIRTEPTSSGDSRVSGPGEIPMRTLDSFAFQDVDFIKVDTEGYEEIVLRGAQQTIEHWRPVICVEQKRDMATRFGLQPLGAVSFLKKLGYRVAQELSGDYLMVYP